MRTSHRAVTAAGLALATAGLLAGPAAAAQPQHRAPRPDGAVFVQTDAPGGNVVVAYDRTPDGGLSQAGSYRTGGTGGVLAGSAVDHTASQGSLLLDRAHHLLYATNSGSDTITIFAVHGDRLTKLQEIGSGGTFPMSVTAHGDEVYVLNARDGGSIQGYLRVGARLVRIPAWHRSLGLNAQATPEFVNTPGQVAFTPDGSRLLVTTKANGNDVDVFPVSPLTGPGRAMVNQDPGAVPFAVAFDARGRVLLAEAGTNSVASFTLDRRGRLHLVDRQATGQAATCWIARDGGHVYAGNAGSGNLSGYRESPDGSLGSLGTTPTAAGQVDVTASGDGRYLYAQVGSTGSLDAFRVHRDGSLTEVGSVTVPDAVGGEGVAAS